MTQKINGIVAYDDNRCMGHTMIGLPWHIPADLQMFKTRTIDHVVIMGRNTWESLPSAPLPHRYNLIVSRKTIDSLNGVSWSKHKLGTAKHPRHENVTVCANLRGAIAYAKKLSPLTILGCKDIFIIGGRQLFRSALDEDLIDVLYVTRVKGVHNGDVFFPALPTVDTRWSVETTSEHKQYDSLIFRRYE